MPLDAIDPTFINAPGGVGPSYDAEELRRNIGFLLAGGATADSSRSGVLDPRGLTVTLSGSNVQVNPGGAAVDAGKGAYLTGAKTTATVDALTPADATNPRRDRVVLEILDPDGGGGAGRKGQFKVITGTPSATAASGGGFPAAPTSPSITLAHIDVPKVGGGNPTVTDLRPFTAAAGAPIPVRNKAERELLPKWNGGTCSRLDRGGAIEYCNGTLWSPVPPAPRIEFASAQNTAASGAIWGMGTFSISDAYAPDTDFASVAGSDLLRVRDAGLYAATMKLAFTAPISGVSWMSIDGQYTVAMGGGLQNFVTSIPDLKLGANATINPVLSHGSGSNRTFTGRLSIMRVG